MSGSLTVPAAVPSERQSWVLPPVRAQEVDEPLVHGQGRGRLHGVGDGSGAGVRAVARPEPPVLRARRTDGGEDEPVAEGSEEVRVGAGGAGHEVELRGCPPRVPSVTQSSLPEAGRLARKKALPSTTGRRRLLGVLVHLNVVGGQGVGPGVRAVRPPEGARDAQLRGQRRECRRDRPADGGVVNRASAPGPGRNSWTSSVPPAVPSLFQSSEPWTPSSAKK